MPKDGLRGVIQRRLRAYHWQPLDIDGLPNLNGCLKGKDIWLHCLATFGWRVEVPQSLVEWMRGRAKVRGRVLVFVNRSSSEGARNRRREVDELWLIDGKYIRELRQNGLKRLPKKAVLGVWDGSPKTWNWLAIAKLLA